MKKQSSEKLSQIELWLAEKGKQNLKTESSAELAFRIDFGTTLKKELIELIGGDPMRGSVAEKKMDRLKDSLYCLGVELAERAKGGLSPEEEEQQWMNARMGSNHRPGKWKNGVYLPDTPTTVLEKEKPNQTNRPKAQFSRMISDTFESEVRNHLAYLVGMCRENKDRQNELKHATGITAIQLDKMWVSGVNSLTIGEVKRLMDFSFTTDNQLSLFTEAEL